MSPDPAWLVRAALAALLLCCSLAAGQEPLPPIPPIKRLLPPEGLRLPEETRQELTARVKTIRERQGADDPDVEVFCKAVDFALRFNEFYDEKKDVAKANKLLDEAERRLEAGETVWGNQTLVARGYRSSVDGSVQPYGIVFPKNYDWKHPSHSRIFVWLHGRGDKATDMHFIHERMSSVGQLGPVDGIVIHPFGRQCVGFKSAGEIDVLDALQSYRETCGIKERAWETILIGFSMGGAGAWHIGAHYGEHFGAVAPGAGFAETAKYTNTDPSRIPWYERKLWVCYDVPCYTRNLFNVPVFAYSGENDKQIQAARVMEDAFKAEGRTLTHLIGPGVGHQYEPKTRDALVKKLCDLTLAIPDVNPLVPIHVQTRTLRYNSTTANWDYARAELWGLEKHWDETRLDAQLNLKGVTEVSTQNVTAFRLRLGQEKYVVDGQTIEIEAMPENHHVSFAKRSGKWEAVERFIAGLRKRPKLQGPIDDAFMEPFLVVAPSGKSKHPRVQRWVEFELEHFLTRWQALMRGEARVKKDSEVTEEDIGQYNLVCFGDPDSNSLIRRALEKLPVSWKDGKVVAGEESFDAANHVPAAIYPNPLAPVDDNQRYLVINSGLTFREAHDRTNSQQNPKLPDWAVIDLTQLPDDKSPGRIAAAGFFNEQWRYQERTDE